ncbi:MAG TPA: DMT family transporter [Pseudorhodoplanes sp.]|nr:DMT family transporter [Pseudorhodoplanes sp.]
MDPFVFAAVLVAAACHASWNAVLKLRLDPFRTVALIAIASAVVALPFLPFVGLPPAKAWPWLIASLILHLGYYIGLTEAYRTGDMGQVYPIARGAAPLFTAGMSTVFLGERLGLIGWSGVVILVAGVLLISLHGGRDLARLDRRAVGFAFFTAVTICGYSLVDGIGARTGGSAHSYSVMLFLLDGAMMAVFAFLRNGKATIADMRDHWRAAFTGGTLSLAAYWIAIWAMTVAPIALVAALRESSVLFAAAIAVIFLKEPLYAARVIAAGLIVAGIVLIRLH